MQDVEAKYGCVECWWVGKHHTAIESKCNPIHGARWDLDDASTITKWEEAFFAAFSPSAFSSGLVFFLSAIARELVTKAHTSTMPWWRLSKTEQKEAHWHATEDVDTRYLKHRTKYTLMHWMTRLPNMSRMKSQLSYLVPHPLQKRIWCWGLLRH
jgi:hypothetical protein